MSTVGIIANPASGQDIRRLISQASVFGNDEKVRIVRRALAGLAAAGVEHVVIMPDSFGIAQKAMDGPDLPLAVSLLEMPVLFDQRDSSRAARRMAELGVRCLITLGGDGTNRAVAKGSGAVPIVPLSTGTNNVFPVMIEATTAGLAAGLVACGKAEAAIMQVPRIEVVRGADGASAAADAEPDDIALVDVAAYDDPFIAARAVWHGSRISDLVVTRADPGNIGLSSIAAHLTGGDYPPGHGVYVRLAEAGQPVTALIAPGLIETVYVAEQRVLAPGDEVVVRHEQPWVLAFDGERDMELRAGAAVRIRVNPAGPRVVDPRQAIAVAARAGAFQ